MPSKSGKQARFMAMVAHDPAAAKRVGVSQSVGKEFNQADKGTGMIKPKKGKKKKGKTPFRKY
jgi:transposase